MTKNPRLGESIGLAVDGGIEHLSRVRIVTVREYGAFRAKEEAGRLYLFANGSGVDPVQRLGLARPRAYGGSMVNDN